jgi:hypothetical protein
MNNFESNGNMPVLLILHTNELIFTCICSLSSNTLVRKNFSRTILMTLFFNCSLNAKYFPVELSSNNSLRRLFKSNKNLGYLKREAENQINQYISH